LKDKNCPFGKESSASNLLYLRDKKVAEYLAKNKKILMEYLQIDIGKACLERCNFE